jgi:hypothetical protein
MQNSTASLSWLYLPKIAGAELGGDYERAGEGVAVHGDYAQVEVLVCFFAAAVSSRNSTILPKKLLFFGMIELRACKRWLL